MRRGSLARARVASLVAGVCLLAAPAWAQAPTGGIAGVVRDTSGAVLPGVTVEAASPALIEQVRSVTTDGQGRYNIVDLRPGVYSVTFTLPGFSSVRRTDIELTTGFTASVNVDLKVGALEETITVAGAAPQVDTQSVRQLTVVGRETLNALPLGQASASNLVALIPGMTDAGNVDIGGTGGQFTANTAYGTFHGKRGLRTTFDGMRTQNSGSGQAPAYAVNNHFVQEVTLETGGLTAEGSSTGMSMNSVPKDGGNTFSFMFAGRFMTEGMQASNLTDELREQGITTNQKLRNLSDVGGYVGGPILHDKLWFYGGVRRWGFRRPIPGLFENATLGSNFYTADPARPVVFQELDQSYGGHITWQASAKNKVGFFTDYQDIYRSHGQAGSPTSAPEAQSPQRLRPTGIVQGTWQSVRTSKLLLDAGAGWMLYHNHSPLQEGVPLNAISILEQSTNFRYNAPATYYSDSNWSNSNVVDRFVQRFGVSYVTGSHTYKAGIQLEEGVINGPVVKSTGPNGGALTYTFNRGVPVSLSMSDTPYVENARMNADLGLYIQDQWTVKRLTLNYGLRYEYWNGSVPAQTLAATRFLPERSFAEVKDAPNYKDLNPRFGAAYDLFGNGRTALKFSLGRYSDLSGTYYTQALDPHRTSISSATRSWNDSFFPVGDPRRGNLVPDCDLNNFQANFECGLINNTAFGGQNPSTVRFADDVIKGWGKRKFTWDMATEVQHQITQGLSVTGGYYHNWDGNIRVLVNQAVTPADFDQYCITAPTDSRLPADVSGQRICGLYNINVAKFGKTDSEWVQSSRYGNGTQRYSDFVSLSTDARLAKGIRFGGGVDTGRTVTDNCFIVDNPQATTVVFITGSVGQRAVEQRFCHEVLDLMANLQVKFHATIPLPAHFVASATFQNVAGDEIAANYTATSAQIAPSLGRPLSGGTATVSIPLIAPSTVFEPRRTQVDLRLTRSFRVGKTRLEADADLYNLFNASSVFAPNATFGPSWLKPTSLVPGRMLQVGAKVTF